MAGIQPIENMSVFSIGFFQNTATKLQWQIRQRVVFKLVTVTFRALLTGVLSYLASEMHLRQPLKLLCTGFTIILHWPQSFFLPAFLCGLGF